MTPPPPSSLPLSLSLSPSASSTTPATMPCHKRPPPRERDTSHKRVRRLMPADESNIKAEGEIDVVVGMVVEGDVGKRDKGSTGNKSLRGVSGDHGEGGRERGKEEGGREGVSGEAETEAETKAQTPQTRQRKRQREQDTGHNVREKRHAGTAAKKLIVA